MKKVVLCYSGGLDSTVLLYYLREQGYSVHCLSVNYGQRHRKELVSAQTLTGPKNLGLPHRILDLSSLREVMGNSSQTDESVPVPEGHYEEESMKQTVVPNRNMVLLSLAGAWAVSLKAEGVAYAAHSGDHAVYPDCRPEFTEAMEDALRLCDWHPVKLLRPFLYPTPMSKADIVKLGVQLKVPLEHSWSCYKGGEKHCGRCSTCVERAEAFLLAGVIDPTEYLDPDYFKSVVGKERLK